MKLLWRKIWRSAAALSLTFLSYLLVLAAKLLRPLGGDRHLRGRNWAFRLWGRGLCRIFGMRIEVEGTPPCGAFFLVANHLSYLDIPLIATQVDAAFVAKSDLRHWPGLGAIFGAADTIFIDRSRKRDVVRVMQMVDKEIRKGLGVLLFPEGTSGKGDEILKFKPSILEFACVQKMPIHWVTLHYEAPQGELPAQRSVCWWGNEGFLPHYRRLVALPQFRAVLRFGSEPVAHDDRKVLAESLRLAMIERFTPVE